MKQKIKIITILFFFAVSFLTFLYADNIKNPSVAGMFYPDSPKELLKMVDDLIFSAQIKEAEKKESEAFIIIVPHAGYGYSGQTAAYAYKLIKDRNYKTIVIIGTGHHYGFSGVSVYPEGKFGTPLGQIEVDKEFSAKLLNSNKDIYFDPKAFEGEHSVEVQLPFLQRTLKDFKIVPLVIGDCPIKLCQELASLLKDAIGQRKDVLVVISSDLYHGYDFEKAAVIDNLTLSFIKDLDAEGLYYALREGRAQACGGFGVVSAIMLAKKMLCNKATLMNYTNSSEVTGDKKKGIWTVGYASVVIDDKSREVAMFNKQEQKRLLEIARSSIESYLKEGRKLKITETEPALLKEMGAFVTLHKKGQLRGCIGNLTGKGPLYLTVRDMAVEAATFDPRFPAVTLDELADIDIEISVLSPMQRIDNPENIRLGIDGVLVRKGLRSGVFLPQVAIETGWNKQEFLSNLCLQKAGLSIDAWKDKDTEVYTFTAEIFSEKKL